MTEPMVYCHGREMWGGWWLVTVRERGRLIPTVRTAASQQEALDSMERVVTALIARNTHTPAEWREIAARGYRRSFYLNGIFALFYLVWVSWQIFTMTQGWSSSWSWITVVLDVGLIALFLVLARRNLRDWARVMEENDE